MSEEQTEDLKVFGKERLVWCSQHRRVHSTGWCTVGVREKMLLEAIDFRSAAIEAIDKGLQS